MPQAPLALAFVLNFPLELSLAAALVAKTETSLRQSRRSPSSQDGLSRAALFTFLLKFVFTSI